LEQKENPMKNPRKNDVDVSNEPLKSVEEITPIYIDTHGEESHRRMVELTKIHGIGIQDDLLKIDFNSNQIVQEQVTDSGLLFIDAHADPVVQRRIVELAQMHGRDQNLLKIDAT
jgi:hypothetical protein